MPENPRGVWKRHWRCRTSSYDIHKKFEELSGDDFDALARTMANVTAGVAVTELISHYRPRSIRTTRLSPC